MNYGLKYLCEYRSKMRGRLLYRIEIEERDALALSERSAIRMRPCADVFTIRWGGSDDPEYTAVKGSTLTLKILCMKDMEYLQLFSADPRKFRVTVYEYRPGTGGRSVRMVLWRGFLAANSYKEDFARPPYVVTLTATDGLSLLGAMPFRDGKGERFTGRQRLSELVGSLFDALGLAADWTEWTNLSAGDPALEPASFHDIHIDRERVYAMKEDPTWRDILELCTQPFNAQVFQAHGVFHVRRIASLRSPLRPVAFDPYAAATGVVRPVVRDLWREGCSLNAATELNLLAPYGAAEVTVDTSDRRETIYRREDWTFGSDLDDPDGPYIAEKWRALVLEDRIFFTGFDPYAEGRVGRVCPAGNTSIEISFNVYNGIMSPFSVYVTLTYRHGARVKYWNDNKKVWADSPSGRLGISLNLEGSDYNAKNKPQFALAKLKSKNCKITLDSIPTLDGDGIGDLYVRVSAGSFSAAVFLSDLDLSFREAEFPSDIAKERLAIAPDSPEKCGWSIPIRDGGYYAYARSMLPNVLLGGDGEPIVSWVAPTERGTLMGIAADDIRLLRSGITRQLAGELRCPDGADLNALFYDGKFTEAVYYVNSLELLAERQVYKVQLRELLDARRSLAPYVWTPVCRFDDVRRLMASLDGTLFLRCGTGPYTVELYFTQTGERRALPYSAAVLDIRKGRGAVVIQAGDTDLYAVDGTGKVLAHRDAQSALDSATALYDADRRLWISYDAVSQAGKTIVTLYEEGAGMLPEQTGHFTATGLLLMANGYTLTATDATYWHCFWHSYELHAPDVLSPVGEPGESVLPGRWRVRAVSDALLVREVSDDGKLQIGLREGLKLKARYIGTELFSDPVSSMSFACNNRIVVGSGVLAALSAEAAAFDMKTGRKYSLKAPVVAGVGVSGLCAYALAQEMIGRPGTLYCLSFEETCFTNKPTNDEHGA